MGRDAGRAGARQRNGRCFAPTGMLQPSRRIGPPKAALVFLVVLAAAAAGCYDAPRLRAPAPLEFRCEEIATLQPVHDASPYAVFNQTADEFAMSLAAAFGDHADHPGATRLGATIRLSGGPGAWTGTYTRDALVAETPLAASTMRDEAVRSLGLAGAPWVDIVYAQHLPAGVLGKAAYAQTIGGLPLADAEGNAGMLVVQYAQDASQTATQPVPPPGAAATASPVPAHRFAVTLAPVYHTSETPLKGVDEAQAIFVASARCTLRAAGSSTLPEGSLAIRRPTQAHLADGVIGYPTDAYVGKPCPGGLREWHVAGDADARTGAPARPITADRIC